MNLRTFPLTRLLTLLRRVALGVLVASAAAMTVGAQQPSRILGTTNLQGWVDDAPNLPNSLAEALARKNGAPYYQPFYDRVEAFKTAYKEAMADRTKTDAAAMRKAAATQASDNMARVNSLPAVAQMGGIDKLALMSPAERAQAAQVMRQNMSANPALLAGAASPGMQALMKQIMSDPGYGARYEKMSPQEKDAELRKFMAGDAAAARATVRDTQPDSRPASARVQAGTDVAATMAIRHDLELMNQERGALEVAFQTADSQITNSKGSHREINEGAVATLERIPMVNDSVMGRVHDIQQEAALNRATAARHHERAAWELEQRSALFADQKLKLKALASSYQSWLRNNQDKINSSVAPADLLRGANTEIEVAGYEQSFVDAAYDLARYSEAVTRDAASYEERASQGTGAIRRSK